MSIPPPPPPQRPGPAAVLVPLLAGVALVLAVTIGVILFTRGDDDGEAATTVASTLVTTTAVATEMDTPPTCTGSTPGAVIEDYFEGFTCLGGASIGIVGDVDVLSDAGAGAYANGSGVGAVTTFEGGLFIVTYPVEVAGGTIRMHFAPNATTPGTRMGIVFHAGDEDADGVEERFVFVSVVPSSQELVAYAMTAAGEFGTGIAVPIPPEAGLLATGWNEFVVIVAPEGFRAEINGTSVYTWTAPLPATSGRVGVGIGGTDGSGERMYLDDFVVTTG